LAAGVALTRGEETCVVLYPRDTWEAATARVAEFDPLLRDARDLQRIVFGGAALVEPDRQGRVVIPAGLRSYAAIEKDVVLVGLRDRLEIWDRTLWHVQLTSLVGRVGDVAERLAQQRV
jgi:MraZ protein